jgi:hypothetical protein
MIRPAPRAAPLALTLGAVALAAGLAAGLAGCGSGASEGPWLTMPDPASHLVDFPMGPDSSHAICSCNECHRQWDQASGTWVDAQSFTSFTCIGCHYTTAQYPGVHHADQAAMATRHAGVVGYEYTDAACKRCHPDGIAVDHAARFPLPHRDAAGTVVTQCAQCHVSAADRKVMGCAGCHQQFDPSTATGHGKVPDFSATDSQRCLRCHADGTVPRVAAHTAFAVGAGAHSGVAGGSCLLCHPQSRAAPKTFAADFAKYTCLGCHVTVGGVDHGSPAALVTIHPGSTAADFTDAACYGCHKDGAAGAPANHPQLFPIGAGTRHAGVGCTECHGSGARTDLTLMRCASCHAALPATATRKAWSAAHSVTGYTITSYQTATVAEGTRTTVQVSMTTPAGCLRCHADSQVDRVASHPGGDSGFGESRHRTAGCFTCHWRMRTDKPWGANFDTASGTRGPPPTSCFVCHASGSG